MKEDIRRKWKMRRSGLREANKKAKEDRIRAEKIRVKDKMKADAEREA